MQPWFNIFQSFVSIWQHNTIIWLFYQLTKLLCFTITSLFIIYTSFTQSVLIVIKAHVFSLMHLKVCWLGICLINAFPIYFVLTLISFLFLNFYFTVCNINTNFIITINTLFFEQQQSMSYKHSSIKWLLIPQKGSILVLSENNCLQAFTVMNSKIPLFIHGRCPTTHNHILYT